MVINQRIKFEINKMIKTKNKTNYEIRKWNRIEYLIILLPLKVWFLVPKRRTNDPGLAKIPDKTWIFQPPERISLDSTTFIIIIHVAQLAEAVEYTNHFSTEG